MKKSFLLILLLVLSPLQSSSQTTQEPYFTNIQLSHDETWPQHVEPTMAVGDDGTIYVGYKNALSHDGGGYSVSFTYSVDGGMNWTKASDMPTMFPSGARLSDPWIVTYGDYVYYSYLDFNEFNSQVTMARSSNKGDTWELARATYGTDFADKETFDIDADGNIFLVYDDVGFTGSLARMSTASHTNYVFEDVIVFGDVASSGYLGPYVEAGSQAGELFVAWTFLGDTVNNSDIFYDHSLDYGKTWQTDLDINPEYNASSFTFTSTGPSIVTLPVVEEDTNGRIYIAWEDVSTNVTGSNFDVWMRWSDNDGQTWSDKVRVNENAENNQWMPDMEIGDDGRVHFAYYDNSTVGGYHVKYRVYNPSTNSFSSEITVTSQPTSSYFSRPGDYLTIKLDTNGIPMIVWSDGRNGEMDVFFGKLVMPNTPTTTSTTTTTTPQTSDNTTDTSNLNFPAIPIILLVAIILPRKKYIKKS